MSQIDDSTAVSDSAGILVSIKSVLVSDRYRKDLGDVSDLADSIVEVGLLNPITVTEYHGGFRLVAGERRLRAFESLGLTDIPARVAHNIVEARDLLVAERDENTQRKPMLPSESAALGLAIEEMERPAALERRNAQLMKGSDSPSGSGDHNGEEVRTRDIAAEAVGMSEPTYRRVKQIMKTIESTEETDEVRDVAREALANIDAGNPVRRELDKLKAAKGNVTPIRPVSQVKAERWVKVADMAAQGYTSAQIFTKVGGFSREGTFRRVAKENGIEFPADKIVGQSRRINPIAVIEKTVLGLEVSADVLDLVSYENVTPDMAAEWLQRLSVPLRAIRAMQTQLKEIK